MNREGGSQAAVLPLVVGMTTLPSRLPFCQPAIDSILAQRRPPDRFILSIPRVPMRGGDPFSSLPDFLTEAPYREQVTINLLDEDFGPGSKLLGALPHCHEPSILVLCDDDMEYWDFMLDRLYSRQVAEPGASFTFFRYHEQGLPIGQGADGFSFCSESLTGIRAFYDLHVSGTPLRMHDDLWISYFLFGRGIPIRDLAPSLGGGLIYRKVHEVDALVALTGSDARHALAVQGMRLLRSAGGLTWTRRARLAIGRLLDPLHKLQGRIRWRLDNGFATVSPSSDI